MNIDKILKISALLIVCLFARTRAETIHKVYFENTDHELHVYEIKGDEPGPTMMIIGGIQGNEPGGYLAADMYADGSLKHGNMIVVPRANFYSILLNDRGPNGDMNRKFAVERPTHIEERIVNILKELITRSDILLNLHDGSGFYRPEYQDEMHNPMRFGQSIIADADVFVGESGKELRLGDIARRICSEVNEDIIEENYKFHFNNHNTVADTTRHPEQRLSATYYALTRHDIPAFGIESSKMIPTDEVKIRHKRLVINAFMDEFGIVPDNPTILLDMPVLNHLIVLINGTERVALKDDETLLLRPGDRIVLEHVDMNYSRGLAADILGMGGINDLGKPFEIDYPTRIIIRKDSYKCATIKIDMTSSPAQTAGIPRVAELAQQASKPALEYVTAMVDGTRHEIRAGETLEVPWASVLVLTEAVLDRATGSEQSVQVNFKGFVGDRSYNSGEDRGYNIHTDAGLLKRFSIDGLGEVYPIEVTYLEDKIGEVFVRILKQRADAGK